MIGLRPDPIRVYLDAETAADIAAILANATSAEVRIEHVYKPTTQRLERPLPPAANGHRPTGRRRGQVTRGNDPSRVFDRIDAHPTQRFRVDDFLDLGLTKKRINGILYRLSDEQHKIERVGRGLFQARRPGRTAGSSKNGAPPRRLKVEKPEKIQRRARRYDAGTSGPNILAYMHQQAHPSVALKARTIAEGMGFTDDRAIAAVRASLNRLVDNEKVERIGDGSYRLPASSTEAGRGDLEVVNGR